MAQKPIQITADESLINMTLEASATAGPGRIAVADVNGRIPAGFLSGAAPALGALAADSITIGTADSTTIHGSPSLSLLRINSESSAIMDIHSHQDTASAGAIIGAMRSRGTIAAPTIVSSGDSIRIDAAYAFDGVDWEIAGYTEWTVGATPGSNDMPGAWALKVTPDGGTTPATAISVAADKSVTLAGSLSIGAGLRLGVLTETHLASTFTDGGAAIGTKAMTGTIPAGAMTMHSRVFVPAGFAGDVSCVLKIGDGVTIDRYAKGTPWVNIFATAATGVAAGYPSGDPLQIAAVSPVLTIVSNADITPVIAGAGSVTVSIVYALPN